jgi:hypothetical protein
MIHDPFQEEDLPEKDHLPKMRLKNPERILDSRFYSRIRTTLSLSNGVSESLASQTRSSYVRS